MSDVDGGRDDTGGIATGTGDDKGYKMFADVEKAATTAVIIEGFAPVKMHSDGSEKSFEAEGGHACKCGSNCTCDPCSC